MSTTPLYDEIRRRYLLMDIPEPEEEPTGWHADLDGNGIADQADAERQRHQFTHDDGTVYERLDPDEFDVEEG